MNAFFASVHQALDPGLRGKPVVVCGDQEKRRGIVLAASYEAKKFGIKTGMGAWEAHQLLPQGIFIKPEHRLYSAFSKRILQIMRDFSPLVEPFSIDEAFLDVTGCEKLFGTSVEIAKQLKARIWNEVGVMCSVGIGPNKLVAKMAAELEKPNGLTIVTSEDVPHRLWPLPIGSLFGVGKKTEQKLILLGLRTIGDLAAAPVELLEKRFGSVGRGLHLSANGINYSPVNPHSHDSLKSIGNQLTLKRDYQGEEIKTAVLDLTESVGRRARRGGYIGRTVSLTLRDTEMGFHSWSMSLAEATDITEDIYRMAVQLLEHNWDLHTKVRLVGVTLSNLEYKDYEQTDLLGEKVKLRKLNQVCDSLKDRFGTGAIRRAASTTEAGIYERLP